MRIFVLGAGVAASHYLPGKKVNQWPPAFLVEWGNNEKLLFECSQAVQQRLEQAGHDYSSIKHIAISHSHPDHCAPIHFDLAVYCKGVYGGERFVSKDLTFYGPDFLIKNFSKLWSVYIPNDSSFKWPKLNLIPMSKVRDPIAIGTSGRLFAREAYHGFGNCPAVSYRLETPEGIVAYSGDTGDCAGVREIAKNADVFICEAQARLDNQDAPRGYGHLNPQTVGDIASRAGVKKVVLFHYTGLDSDKAITAGVKRAGFKGEVVAGKDFQVIYV